MIKLHQKSGLVLILEKIRNLESSDPDCDEYPRFKPHDDIAAIAIKM